jgi:ribosome-binding protein aMBF1 (putative translation factor)
MFVFQGRSSQAIETIEDLAKAIEVKRRAQKLSQVDLAGLASTGNRFIVDLESAKPSCQIQKVLDVLKTLGIKLYIE